MRRLACYLGLAVAALVMAYPDMAHAFGRHRRCGGCSDPCYTSFAPSGPACPPPVCLDIGPVTQMHVVLCPTYVTEKRSYCTTEYRDEQRTRAVTCWKTVEVQEERVRVVTVPTTRTETKTIEYTVPVAVAGEEKKTYTVKVPVWTDQEEKYTVKVPVLKQAEETYCVQVPVIRDVPFTYTVNVPYPEIRPVTHTVSTVVPVVKTRTMSYCVPVTRTKICPVDRGHWENRVEPAYAAGHVQAPGKSPVQAHVQAPGKSEKQAPAPAPVPLVCRQVWVPNIVNEEVTETVPTTQTAEVQYLVYEQHYKTVPYECPCVVYRPEQRSGMKKEVVYQMETRTRPRTVVEYVDEPRTRIKKVLSFKDEERTETFPVISYQNEKRTKEVTYTVCVPESRTETYTVTRCEQVPDHKIENYTVRVCVPVVKEMEVQVCRMVPKVVSVTVCPCPGVQTPGKPSPIQKGPQQAPQQAPPKVAALPQDAPACCGSKIEVL